MSDQIDASAILDEALELTRRGLYADALHRHLWFHQHALEIRPSLCGVRLSFALSYWLDLGKVYPPALEAMRAVRDAKESEISEGGGSWGLFSDVTALNGYLEETARTVELFRQLDAARPEMARECYSVAEEALVAGREYALCGRYLTDLDPTLDKMRDHREDLLRFQEEYCGDLDEQAKRVPESIFAGDVGRVVAVLDGTGRAEDAERVRRWARSISDCSEVREAIGGAPPLPG